MNTVGVSQQVKFSAELQAHTRALEVQTNHGGSVGLVSGGSGPQRRISELEANNLI